MLARQTPEGESRPVPIGSRLIGVSLRPAIPRRVAPQQSPPPLHQSATIVAEPATPIKCEARPHRCHLGCHLYFARRVTFLSCADTWTANAIKSVSGFFQDAAMLGVTVFVASGDAGSDGGIGDKKGHVLYPASDPFVNCCGGT